MGTTRSTSDAEDAAGVLNRLRLVLVGLRMWGIEDWPKRSARIEPASPVGVEKTAAEDDIDRAILDIRQELGDCRRCRLHADRTHIVFGEGSSQARLVFVGEGPGFDEDRLGRPFVGRAGRLLDKMIRALGFGREEVYICNVVKCRPPDNRTPNPDEIEKCSRFLMQQLDALRPRVICALGSCAAQTLLASTSSISRLRGKLHYWRGVPVICTFHPAYLLRNPLQKASSWQDLRETHKILHSSVGD